MKAASNSWIWAAMDFADGEGKLEKFAARFKTSEQASEFQQIFEKAKTTDAAKSKSTSEPQGVKANEPVKPVPQGFGDKFAPKSGTWSCTICYVSNKSDSVKCVACETAKPGTATTAAPASTSATQFKFGIPSATPATSSSATASIPGVSFNSASTIGGSSVPGVKFGMPVSSSVGVTPSVGGAFSSGIKFGMATTTSTAPTVPTTGGNPTTAIKFGIPPTPITPISSASSILPLSGETTTTGIKFGVPVTPASSTESVLPAAGGILATGVKFGMPASKSSPSFTFSSTPVVTSASSTSGFGSSSVTTPSVPTVTTSTASSLAFGTSKPSFSFSLPPSTTSTAITKAPFSFSPPKLAVASAPSKTNGQSDLSTSAPPNTNTAIFSSSAFGTPKALATSSVVTPTASVLPGSLFGTPKPVVSETKSVFGGFSFTSPAVKPVIEEAKTETKSSPFAGFSFQGFGATQNKDTSDKKPESGMLFSLLAQQTPSAGFSIAPNKEFPGTGAPLFSSSTSTKPKENNQDENEEDNDGGEYEPNVAFEPVVPLPALIEVSTGEEEENVLFSDRAFLYRFVPDTKEWKEKGRGDMKILEHKTTGRVRLLMRREQVLKVCCNHNLTSQLSLKPLQTSDRTWTWTAQDFSEGELVQEMFALKFKTVDQAQKFKTVFEEAQKKQANTCSEPTKEEVKIQPAVTKSLAEMFKPKEGSWECQGCFLRNASHIVKCPSCETIKPGSEATIETPTSKASPAFSFSSTGGFTFNSSAPPSKNLGTVTSTNSGTTGFSGFDFSMSPSVFASPRRPETKPVIRSPNASAGSDNEYYEEEGEGDDIHFEPVIAMPEKIQVRTGEEDEEVVYCHRAKLFRLVDGEWKERGLGDIKILQHKTSCKTRFLMRREQVLKICLNHALNPDLLFKPKDERSWLWAAQDFTEGEGRLETFVIRFRDAEAANDFIRNVHEYQNAGITESADVSKTTADELEMVFAKEATEEQKRKAKELKLPLNFFLYETAPPCPGCRGCERDDDEEADVKPNLVSSTKEATPKTDGNLFSNASWMKVTDSSSQLSFSSLASTSASGFSKPSTFSWSGAGKPIFGQSTASPLQQEEKPSNVDEDDGEVPESTDPHFEPIIPLPALIDVKTGEEDEEVVFSHRAKLYRFESATKEWKEKGVGDIKILHHLEKKTYRVLLRRDQIHKLACNHWLTPDMSLKPLSTSTTAWTWFAMDFSQGELVSEHFAVRFKTEEPALLFKTKFEACQAVLRGGAPQNHIEKNSPASIVVPLTENVPVPSKKTEEHEDVEAEDDTAEEEQDEEEYEDVEESIMFEKRCTLSSLEDRAAEKTWVLLGTGDLKIVYDDEMLCARIVVEDGNEQLLCDNVIAIETELKVNERECIWSAIDYSSEESAHRTFRAQFSSTDAALEFQSMFAEAKQFAEKSDVHDEPDMHAAAGYDHSNDDHGDYVEGKF